MIIRGTLVSLLFIVSSGFVWCMEDNNIAHPLPSQEPMENINLIAQGEWVGAWGTKEGESVFYKPVKTSTQGEKLLKKPIYLGKKKVCCAIESETGATIIGSDKTLRDNFTYNVMLCPINGDSQYFCLAQQDGTLAPITHIVTGSLYTRPLIFVYSPWSQNFLIITKNKENWENYSIKSAFSFTSNEGVQELRMVPLHDNRLGLCVTTNKSQLHIFEFKIYDTLNAGKTFHNTMNFLGNFALGTDLSGSVAGKGPVATEQRCWLDAINSSQLQGYTKPFAVGESLYVMRRDTETKNGVDTKNDYENNYYAYLLDCNNCSNTSKIRLSSDVIPYAYYKVPCDVNKNTYKEFVVGSSSLGYGSSFVLKRYALQKKPACHEYEEVPLLTSLEGEWLIDSMSGVKLLKNSLFLLTNKRLIQCNVLKNGEKTLRTFAQNEAPVGIATGEDAIALSIQHNGAADANTYSVVWYPVESEECNLYNDKNSYAQLLQENNKNKDYIENLEISRDDLLEKNSELKKKLKEKEKQNKELQCAHESNKLQEKNDTIQNKLNEAEKLSKKPSHDSQKEKPKGIEQTKPRTWFGWLKGEMPKYVGGFTIGGCLVYLLCNSAESTYQESFFSRVNIFVRDIISSAKSRLVH